MRALEQCMRALEQAYRMESVLVPSYQGPTNLKKEIMTRRKTSLKKSLDICEQLI